MTDTVLDKAKQLIYVDREKEYGPPQQNYEDVAKAWSFITGFPLTAKQVCLMLAMLKIVRERNSVTGKHDNLIDAIGYLGLIERLNETPSVTGKSSTSTIPQKGISDDLTDLLNS